MDLKFMVALIVLLTLSQIVNSRKTSYKTLVKTIKQCKNSGGYLCKFTKDCKPQCIAKSALCNGKPECSLNDDEENCDSLPCEPLPPPIEHGDYTIISQDTALLKCVDGYTLYQSDPNKVPGLAFIRCMATGMWSKIDATIKCVKEDCGEPTDIPVNGQFLQTVNKNVRIFACNDGYDIFRSDPLTKQPPHIITCVASGLWTALLASVRCSKECPTNLTNNDGKIKTTLTTTGYLAEGAKVTATCCEGFKFDTELTAYAYMCSADGQWLQPMAFSCIPTGCGSPEQQIPNGGFIQTEDPAVMEVVCKRRYDFTRQDPTTPVDPPTITCGADGIWSTLPDPEQICSKECVVPNADRCLDYFNHTFAYIAEGALLNGLCSCDVTNDDFNDFECQDGFLVAINGFTCS